MTLGTQRTPSSGIPTASLVLHRPDLKIPQGVQLLQRRITTWGLNLCWRVSQCPWWPRSVRRGLSSRTGHRQFLILSEHGRGSDESICVVKKGPLLQRPTPSAGPPTEITKITLCTLSPLITRENRSSVRNIFLVYLLRIPHTKL